jgi:hypothetical protein
MKLYKVTNGETVHFVTGTRRDAHYWAVDHCDHSLKVGIKEVKADFYDNGGKTYDRITVVLTETGFRSRDGKKYDYIGTSETGSGFFQHGHWCIKGPHLGRKVKFTDLHQDLQKRLKNYFAESK